MVLWNEALTNLHTSWGAPGRHASLLGSFVVRDEKGMKKKKKKNGGTEEKSNDGGRGGVKRWSEEARGEERATGPVVILQGVWGCQRPCNPPPTPALHPLSIIPSTSPWQTGSALYQRATGYLSSFSSFLTQRSSSHLSFPLPGSAHRDRLLLPGLAAELPGLARRSHQFPQWQHLESHLMGLGAFANLSTSFGYGARCQAGWSGTWLERISIGRPFLEPWVKSNSKAFAYLTIYGLALEAAELNAEWLENRMMDWLFIFIVGRQLWE